MAEKKAPSSDNALFFFTVVKHMKGKPETDWDAVAAELGYNNADTARTRFGQIKRKLGLTSEKTTTPKANRVTKSTPKSKGSAKAKKMAAKVMEEQEAEAELDMDIEDTAPNTPTPYFKTEAGAGALKLQDEGEQKLPDYEDEDEDEV